MTEGAAALPTGRVDAEGVVFVRLPSGTEHRVGQWAAGEPAAGLAFFQRRFDDLAAEVELAIRRLADGKSNADSAHQTSAKVRAALVEPSCVGDIAALLLRLDALDDLVRTQRVAATEAKKAAKAAAVAERVAIVDEAERLSTSTQWKSTGERYKELLTDWQAKPHGERNTEQELWKRFSNARSAFDKARRTHFATVDIVRAEAKLAKTSLLKRAEELSESTDWTSTATAFRDLMAEWKIAPRGNRVEEDRYWATFRDAQEKFFAARSAALDVRDADLKGNLATKEALATEAEALLPVKDAEASKAALRRIQERWEKAGHVPRNDKERIDARLRRVEEAVRNSEQDRWRRSNPEAGARARSTVELFLGSVLKLEKALAAAQASNDSKSIDQAQADLAAQRGLLAAAEAAAEEFSS
ncbi:MAG: DUF349 domain-containing protein [Actinomycetes bacterium]